jgi:hypothetical protein
LKRGKNLFVGEISCGTEEDKSIGMCRAVHRRNVEFFTAYSEWIVGGRIGV